MPYTLSTTGLEHSSHIAVIIFELFCLPFNSKYGQWHMADGTTSHVSSDFLCCKQFSGVRALTNVREALNWLNFVEHHSLLYYSNYAHHLLNGKVLLHQSRIESIPENLTNWTIWPEWNGSSRVNYIRWHGRNDRSTGKRNISCLQLIMQPDGLDGKQS